MLESRNKEAEMYRFNMTARIEQDLARLDELRTALDSRGALPLRWVGRLRRELEVESATASTAMEGVPVTVREVRRLFAGDPPRSLDPEDAALVEGYRHAMRLVLRRAEDAGFAWERELILAIHDKVLGESVRLQAGRFRTTAIWISDGRSEKPTFTPPAAKVVPALVGDLTAYRRSSVDVAPAVLSALAHVRLAGIHPFSDGNGRTSRIVASLVMLRAGYRAPEFTSLEEWWGRHLPDYYAAFRCLGADWDERSDVTPFIEAHVGAQRLQADTLSLRQASEREIWDALELVVQEAGADVRTANALWDAFFGRTVTNRYYRGIADVSPATAAIDLARMVAAGLLAVEGSTRHTQYAPASGLFASVARTMGFDDLAGSAAPDEMVRDLIIGKIATRIRLSGPVYTAGIAE
jgi:Fic family protein